MSGDYLFAGPDLMARYGAMLNEPADLAQEILTQYRAGKDALGDRPWGYGDEIAEVFEGKFVPGDQQFEEYVGAFVEVLRETAANTVRNAEQLRTADLGGESIGLDLVRSMPDSPDSPGGPGDFGDLRGGRHGWR